MYFVYKLPLKTPARPIKPHLQPKSNVSSRQAAFSLTFELLCIESTDMPHPVANNDVKGQACRALKPIQASAKSASK